MPTEELFGNYNFAFNSKHGEGPRETMTFVFSKFPAVPDDAGASIRDGTSNTVLLAEDHVSARTGGTRDHDHAGAYSFAVEIDGITATGIATHTDWHLV